MDALAQALELLKDDGLVARLSKEAHDLFWRDPPTLDRHVQQISAIYREMLDRGHSAA